MTFGTDYWLVFHHKTTGSGTMLGTVVDFASLRFPMESLYFLPKPSNEQQSVLGNNTPISLLLYINVYVYIITLVNLDEYLMSGPYDIPTS